MSISCTGGILENQSLWIHFVKLKEKYILLVIRLFSLNLFIMWQSFLGSLRDNHLAKDKIWFWGKQQQFCWLLQLQSDRPVLAKYVHQSASEIYHQTSWKALIDTSKPILIICNGNGRSQYLCKLYLKSYIY